MITYAIEDYADYNSGNHETIAHFSTREKAESAIEEMAKDNYLYIGTNELEISEYEIDFFEQKDCTGAIVQTIDMR